MMAVYSQNMLCIKIKVTVTIVCCTVMEIYIDEIKANVCLDFSLWLDE
jgi:hypothetical protein